MKQHFILLMVFVLGLTICITSISFTTTNTPNEQLLKIAGEYKTYLRYDNVTNDNAALSWTVTTCASISSLQKNIDSLHFSKASSSVSQHGNKLYKLYVKDLRSYTDTTKKMQPLGQVLVKETWNVHEIPKDSISTTLYAMKQSKNDGKWYTPTTVSELFIMYKEEKNEKNDEGWVYGIVSMESPKSKATILENGKLSTCISCHKGTKYDRIFGTK